MPNPPVDDPAESPARPLTPGAFLRRCRLAAGMSLDDVALRTETTPKVSARARADMLATIESDLTPISYLEVAALQRVYGFAWDEMADGCAAAAAIAPTPALSSAA